MNTHPTIHRSVKVIRWIARIWSLVVAVPVILMIVLSVNPSDMASISTINWFLIGLRLAAVVGLLIAWRWELAGGIITIAARIVHEIVWFLVNGEMAAGYLITWVFVLPPAILFIVAWVMQRKSRKS